MFKSPHLRIFILACTILIALATYFGYYYFFNTDTYWYLYNWFLLNEGSKFYVDTTDSKGIIMFYIFSVFTWIYSYLPDGMHTYWNIIQTGINILFFWLLGYYTYSYLPRWDRHREFIIPAIIAVIFFLYTPVFLWGFQLGADIIVNIFMITTLYFYLKFHRDGWQSDMIWFHIFGASMFFVRASHIGIYAILGIAGLIMTQYKWRYIIWWAICTLLIFGSILGYIASYGGLQGFMDIYFWYLPSYATWSSGSVSFAHAKHYLYAIFPYLSIFLITLIISRQRWDLNTHVGRVFLICGLFMTYIVTRPQYHWHYFVLLAPFVFIGMMWVMERLSRYISYRWILTILSIHFITILSWWHNNYILNNYIVQNDGFRYNQWRNMYEIQSIKIYIWNSTFMVHGFGWPELYFLSWYNPHIEVLNTIWIGINNIENLKEASKVIDYIKRAEPEFILIFDDFMNFPDDIIRNKAITPNYVLIEKIWRVNIFQIR